MTQVAQIERVHPNQLPPVQTDLNRKREPGLNTRVQETEDWMNHVVVQEQALAQTRLELQVLGVSVA